MWLIYTLATTLLWGLAELFYKKGAVEREKYSHLKICVMVGLVMGIHAVFTLLTEDMGYSLTYLWPSPSSECASSRNPSPTPLRTPPAPCVP